MYVEEAGKIFKQFGRYGEHFFPLNQCTQKCWQDFISTQLCLCEEVILNYPSINMYDFICIENFLCKRVTEGLL